MPEENVEIHTWWPHLSIDAKQVLEEEVGASVPESVLAEIREITGAPVESLVLSEEDVSFIHTQRQAVD